MAVPKSAVIREYCPASKRVVIRTTTYAHSLEYFLMLYTVAQEDFPKLDLTPEIVDIVHFGGQCYAKTDGIEFSCEPELVPKTYTEIDQLEFTR